MQPIARVRVLRVEVSSIHRKIDPSDRSNSPDNLETVEQRTVVLSPVHTSNDPRDENTKVWSADFVGTEIRIGTLDPEAWNALGVGRDFLVTFAPAPPLLLKPPPAEVDIRPWKESDYPKPDQKPKPDAEVPRPQEIVNPKQPDPPKQPDQPNPQDQPKVWISPKRL